MAFGRKKQELDPWDEGFDTRGAGAAVAETPPEKTQDAVPAQLAAAGWAPADEATAAFLGAEEQARYRASMRRMVIVVAVGLALLFFALYSMVNVNAKSARERVLNPSPFAVLAGGTGTNRLAEARAAERAVWAESRRYFWYAGGAAVAVAAMAALGGWSKWRGMQKRLATGPLVKQMRCVGKEADRRENHSYYYLLLEEDDKHDKERVKARLYHQVQSGDELLRVRWPDSYEDGLYKAPC